MRVNPYKWLFESRCSSLSVRFVFALDSDLLRRHEDFKFSEKALNFVHKERPR